MEGWLGILFFPVEKKKKDLDFEKKDGGGAAGRGTCGQNIRYEGREESGGRAPGIICDWDGD